MVHSSRFLVVFLWAASFFHALVLASDYGEESTNKKCKDLLQRREWCQLSSTSLHLNLLTLCGRRRLNNTEKADYIKAIKCLQSRLPLYQNIEAVKTRFDEFQALHINVADRIHTTVQFILTGRDLMHILLGPVLALALTFCQPLRKRSTWWVRLQRGNAVCGDIVRRLQLSLLFRCRYWDWTLDADQSTLYVHFFTLLTEPDIISF